MLKYLRNSFLIFTNNGLKKIEDINKNNGDKIVIYKDGRYEYGEIDNIEKVYKKHYKLNKINFINSTSSFYINDNIEIKTIVNIPSSIENTIDIPEYLDYNKNRCIGMTRISNLSSFDYIGFPINFDIQMSVSNTNMNDYYRFMGLLLATSSLSFYINSDKEETIKFITSFLDKNEIRYEIMEKDKKNIIKYDNEMIKKNMKIIDLNEILIIHKEQLVEFVNGLVENESEYVINNRDIYEIIKYACIRIGILTSSYYKDDKYHIKIYKNPSKNHLIYDEYVWNKIRNIKKVDYNGFLYKLELMDNCPYLTELGLIS